jgi:hypothetical protein
MEQPIACPSVSCNDKGLIKRSLNFPLAGARIGAWIAGIAAAFRNMPTANRMAFAVLHLSFKHQSNAAGCRNM